MISLGYCDLPTNLKSMGTAIQTLTDPSIWARQKAIIRFLWRFFSSITLSWSG